MTSTLTAPHRGAGPRYSPVRRPAAAMLRVDQGDGVARYYVATTLARTVATLVTLATLATVLLTLALAGTGDLARECRDIVTGSEDVTSAATCRDMFGPRGY